MNTVIDKKVELNESFSNNSEKTIIEYDDKNKDKSTEKSNQKIKNSDKINVYPITFSFPDQKIPKEFKQKIRFLSELIPGKIDTYIYKTEKEYYEQYQESNFAITCKKGGWDCLRHYEIIANGCVPIFPNIEQCPEKTMCFYPKKLQIEANDFYASLIKTGFQTKEQMDKYSELRQQFFNHLTKNLTTTSIARYILNGRTPDKILFLSENPGPDYMRCLTLIGLKTLYGIKCHDFPKVKHIYQNHGINPNLLYGNGMTYSSVLSQNYHGDSEDDNYYVVKDKIIAHYYDLIIYGSSTRSLILINTVLSNYNKDDIIYLNGEDEQLNEEFCTFNNCYVRELK